MGIEFFDLESPYNEMLIAWIDALRQARECAPVLILNE